MQVRVLFFGPLAEATGLREDSLDMPPGSQLGELRRHYETLYPELTLWRNHLQMAINREMMQDTAALAEGDEVAWLPPASGG